ncbi:MAG: hypothetical protein IMZ50_06975 [Candidatus Atribacteria bacterium]|nr:hypothetical protein [Candidatus Atribacteria bacterium]
MKNKSQANIQCPTEGLFSQQEEEIGRLTQTINQVQGAAQKAAHALVLIDAVEVLLACQAYDQENLNCRLCRNISQLRFKTYNLVVKAGRLEDSRRRSAGNDR